MPKSKSSSKVRPMQEMLAKEYTISSVPRHLNYVYPGSATLKNKYGIRDYHDFTAQCAHDSTKAMINLRQEAPPDRFDAEYLKYIHKQLFQEAFEWAGHTRDIPFTFSDGTTAVMPYMKKLSSKTLFAEGEKVQKGLKALEAVLIRRNNLRGLSREDFCDDAAECFAFLNHIHPFREGNGRTQRMFFEKIAEAAGHTLDFSLVTCKRMTMASVFVEENGNLGPMKHLFEDISNPEKRIILKEFMHQMSLMGRYDIHDRYVVAAQENETYKGIYRGAYAEGFVVENKEGSYIIGKKDYLSPEKLKTLKFGDRLTFTVPGAEDLEQIFIPKEKFSPLTKKEISEILKSDIFIQEQKKEVQRLSKIVYGSCNVLNRQMDRVIAGSKSSENVAEKIAQSPRSIAGLAGLKVFGIANHRRERAEEHILDLSEAFEQYVICVKSLEETLIQDCKDEQRRRAQEIKTPSKALRDVLFKPKEERSKILASSSELKKELGEFICEVRSRLSVSESAAVRANNYEKLAESIGISVGKAHSIIDFIQRSREAYRQIPTPTVERSQKIMAMPS